VFNSKISNDYSLHFSWNNGKIEESCDHRVYIKKEILIICNIAWGAYTKF
jgi:hypothetical protein